MADHSMGKRLSELVFQGLVNFLNHPYAESLYLHVDYIDGQNFSAWWNNFYSLKSYYEFKKICTAFWEGR